MIPFAVANGSRCLVLGEKIPEEDAVGLWRVLQTVRRFRAFAVRPDIESLERVVVTLPKGHTCPHHERLYVKLDCTVAQSYVFRDGHTFSVQGERIHSLDFFEHTRVCLPMAGSHGDLNMLSGGNWTPSPKA